MARRRNFSNGRSKKAPTTNGSGNGQDLFRSCFSHAAIGFSVTDPDGRFLEANEAYCSMMGYTPAELRGLDIQTLTHPDDLQKTNESLQSLLTGDVPAFVIEKRKIRKNGDIIWAQNSVSLIRDLEGRPLNFVQLTQDITEARRVRRALEESEHRFRAFMKNFPGNAWIKDAEGRYVYINEAVKKILLVHKDDWRGRTDEDLWAAENAAQYRRNDLQVLNDGQELQTVEHLFHEGQVRSLLVTKFPIFDKGDRTMVGGTAVDITELKQAEDSRAQAERKFREIFENAAEGIFQSTPEGKYLAANPALARMYGYESPEALIEGCQDISQQIYADPARREEFKRLMETEGVVRDFEMKTLRQNGSKLWVSVSARAVRGANGTVSYYEGISQDITERKLAEDKSAAFATLARKLSGARTKVEAARIIAETAQNLFSWDACNLDLYDAKQDLVFPLLNIDTIDGESRDVTALISVGPPSAKAQRVIQGGPHLVLRDEPIRFDADSVPFGDTSRPSASFMTVPVRHGEDVVGVLSIQSYKRGAYDERALSDFVSLADHCGEAFNRIHAEELLRDSEERFRQLAEHLEDVVWIADRGLTQVLYINPAYERVFGRSCRSVYDRLTSFVDAVHPDDRESVNQMLERQRQGDYRPLEYRIIRPDGSLRWLLRRAFPIRNREGEIYRIAGIAQDITERKRAQEEVRESEERYRDLVENSHELMCTHDLDGTVLSVNRAAVELFGYEPHEFVGTGNIRDILAPEVRDQFQDYMAKILKHRATSGLMLVQTHSGERRILEYYNSLRTDGVAAPIVRGMARDVTEQRRAENALRESEERYRELFENAKDAIYVHDLRGRYVSVNRAAERLSGYSRDEIIGKHYSNFVVPRDLAQVRTSFARKLDHVPETTYEVDVMRKDRRRVPVEVSSRLIYENGEPVGVQGVARDISERKRAEEARSQLALIVESSDDAIIGKTLDGIILSWNRGAEQMYGYSAREIVGCPITVVVPSDRLGDVALHLAKIRRGESIKHSESLGRRKDGKLINVSLSISPVKNAQGKIIGAATIARDITQHKQAEQVLKTFSRRLVEAQEAERKKIARELHDEIGQILTAVRISLQSIQRTWEPSAPVPRIEESISVVDEALDRVRELSLELRPALLDDLGLAAALRWYLNRYSERTGIPGEVTSNFSDDLRLPRKLETACFRIVQEALTNVARHAEASTVKIALNRFRRGLELKVIDDGKGFDATGLFANASSQSLGLHGIQERAFAVGGNIEIQTAPGQGTCLSATFPLKSRSGAQASAA